MSSDHGGIGLGGEREERYAGQAQAHDRPGLRRLGWGGRERRIAESMLGWSRWWKVGLATQPGGAAAEKVGAGEQS